MSELERDHVKTVLIRAVVNEVGWFDGLKLAVINELNSIKERGKKK